MVLDKMDLLMIVLNQVNRGTYWRAFQLARRLCQRGHRVTLMATSPTERFIIHSREIQENLILVETPDLFYGSLRSGWDVWNTIKRIAWLRGKSFDLIHAFESRPTVIFPALYMHSKSIPLIMDWADYFGKGGSVEERPNPLIRNILRPVETYFEQNFRTLADGTTVICSSLQNKASGLGVSPDSILILRNGADVDRLTPILKDVARSRLGVEKKVPVIGYVGSIFHGDALFMAEAFNRVLIACPTALLLVVGYFPFDIKTLVSKPEQVIQTGILTDDDLNLYLAMSDVFWLPLRNTNANRGRFPYKFTDYLSIGRPIIATSVGDMPQLFADGEIGYLSIDDPKPFSQDTIKLLSDSNIREVMGQKARKIAESEFSWDVFTNELELFYQKVILQKRAQKYQLLG
jgi:glycosyltransferase involved in cell wall biosynthesis